jgi:hypothetical protein
MNKQTWIAEFAKEFQAQTNVKYRACFDVAASVYDSYAESEGLSPDEAVQEELSHWYG